MVEHSASKGNPRGHRPSGNKVSLPGHRRLASRARGSMIISKVISNNRNKGISKATSSSHSKGIHRAKGTSRGISSPKRAP